MLFIDCVRSLKMVTASLTLIITSFFRGSSSLPVESCPMFGCRPSGTFSYDLDVTKNVSIVWHQPFQQLYLPDELGCIGNAELVVCQGDGKTNRYVKGKFNMYVYILIIISNIPVSNVD